MENEAQWYHLRNLYHIDPYLTANKVYVDWLGTESGAVEGKPLEGPGMIGTHGYREGAAPRVARLSDAFMVAKALEKLLLTTVFAPTTYGYITSVGQLGIGPLDPTGGWQDHNALNADLDRYIKLQKQLEEKIGHWNSQNGNRMRGTTIFTVGAPFVGWNNFKLWEDEMDAFAEAFAA